MNTLFDIPPKYFVSKEMEAMLASSPLVIADVGAAMGLDSRWKPLANHIEVLSFEPDARSEAEGKVFRTALGAESDGTQTLHLTSLPAASSFFSHDPEMNRFVVKDWLKPAGTCEVPVTTLDSCVGEQQIDFLKIDVEGADLDVLRGATHTLSRGVLAIQIEVSFSNRHQDAPTFSDIDQFLRNRGFYLHHVSNEHWLRINAAYGSNSRPQQIWGDALYLKRVIQPDDYAKWMLICQAYGLHDLAIDQLPEDWHKTAHHSVRSHSAFCFMAIWRLLLATLLLPVTGRKAWRKWKQIASELFRRMADVTSRSGPRNGVFPNH